MLMLIAHLRICVYHSLFLRENWELSGGWRCQSRWEIDLHAGRVSNSTDFVLDPVGMIK